MLDVVKQKEWVPDVDALDAVHAVRVPTCLRRFVACGEKCAMFTICQTQSIKH